MLKNQEEGQRRWYWYHGVIFYALVQGLAFGLSGLVSAGRRYAKGDQNEALRDIAYFRSLKQAKITPPSWAFGPVWTINTLSMIWGLLRVLNKPVQEQGRLEYLTLQAASWLNYILFNGAYFGLRSPINAFVLTLSMFLLTIVSGLVAFCRLRDSWVALSLATLFIWLLIALPAAIFQAAWNYDECYGVGPFARPIAGWVKSSQS